MNEWNPLEQIIVITGCICTGMLIGYVLCGLYEAACDRVRGK